MRVYNFSAGPSMLPLEVLKEAQRDLTDYNGSGMSVMEMSHRSANYDSIHNECIALFRELLNISDDYDVLLVQGGASTQFEAVPLNMLKGGKADYIVTGNFAKKAYKESLKYGDIKLAASSEDKNFTYIPRNVEIRKDADYLHICHNNTIFGTRYTELPKCDCPIVADMSSSILSEVINVNDYGVIYAGAQKNIAPAGVTLVIVRKDLEEDRGLDFCPTMLKWSTQAKNNSLYNTPPTFAIYVAMLNLRYIKKLGGLSAMQKINEEKANLLYDYIDSTDFYTNNVNKADRSMMNVPFVTANADLDKKFIAEAAKEGLVSLKGHKLVGGMRASIYNSMPREGILKLIAFMKEFAANNA